MEGLDIGSFKVGFKQLLTDMRTRTDISDDEYVERFSNLLDTYTKSAKIVYEDGLTAPNGAVTGTFNGNLE